MGIRGGKFVASAVLLLALRRLFAMPGLTSLAWLWIYCALCLHQSSVATVVAAAVGRAKSTNTMIPPARTQVSPDDTQEQEEDKDAPRDVVIIGSGPSGCTAAIYTARAMLRPLVIAGSQIHTCYERHHALNAT